MLMLDTLPPQAPANGGDTDRADLIKSLDMASLWQSCAALISKALPCHSCSLLFDIDGYQPHQGRHHLSAGHDDGTRMVNSLDVAAPYLDANPRIPWYTFSQIARQDVTAGERLKAQNPSPGWQDFIHMAFWNGARLEAVLSIRLRADHARLSARELGFLSDLYPLLDASLQRVRALESERGRQHALTTLLHGLPLAVILLDDHLAPSCMSLEAMRICRRWSTDTERAGRLPHAIDAPLRAWFLSTAAASAGGGGEPSPGTSLSLRHPSRPQLQLRVEIGFTPRRPGERAHHLLILSTGGEDEGIDASSPRTLSLLQCLSPSERKVALLVAGGLRNDMIAQKLCRSRKTIESQISSIFRKLNVGNRTQLARLFD